MADLTRERRPQILVSLHVILEVYPRVLETPYSDKTSIGETGKYEEEVGLETL